MVSSVNWFFDGFLMLFNLHVFFPMFFYFWNVGLSSSCHALISFFILFILMSAHCLPYVHFPPSAHFPPGCTSVTHSLYFLLLLRTLTILQGVPKLPLYVLVGNIELNQGPHQVWFTHINSNDLFNVMFMLDPKSNMTSSIS